MAHRYWTAEILLSNFHPPKLEIWDMMDRYKWSLNYLEDTNNDTIIRMIARDVSVLYNPLALLVYPSCGCQWCVFVGANSDELAMHEAEHHSEHLMAIPSKDLLN